MNEYHEQYPEMVWENGAVRQFPFDCPRCGQVTWYEPGALVESLVSEDGCNCLE
jgi:hypothetical protein